MNTASALVLLGLAQAARNFTWIWAVIILVIVILLLWWLGREESREPLEGGRPARQPEIGPMKTDTGLPEVSQVARSEPALAQAGMVTDETPAAVVEEPPVVEALEHAPVVEVPEAGENVEVIESESTPEVVEAAAAETPVEEIKMEPVMPAATKAADEALAETPTRNENALENLVGTENPVEQAVETAAPIQPDDLEIVEGIGPKIAGMLKAHGIVTFAQLAATDVAVLQKIMLEANLRIADPGTWPEQARLAAEGKFEELQKLQDSLRGGRKVA